jgi:hypothetical protein
MQTTSKNREQLFKVEKRVRYSFSHTSDKRAVFLLSQKALKAEQLPLARG